jgi:hypothetical protein
MSDFMTYEPAERLYQAAKAAAAALGANGIECQELSEALGECEKAAAYRAFHKSEIARAREEYVDDDLAIDDKPVTSDAGDGVWISAWVWVQA